MTDLRADGSRRLYQMKTYNTSIHGGPFGHLVREIAFHARRLSQHDYLDIPEIVEDIGSCFASYFHHRPGVDLNQRFRDATKPCIVKFQTTIPDDYARHAWPAALLYVYAALHGDAVYYDSLCGYDAKGRLIPAQDILAIMWPP